MVIGHGELMSMGVDMSMSIGMGREATRKGWEVRRGKRTGRKIEGLATSLLFNLHLFMFKHLMSMGIWQAHTRVGLTWNINSYAQVQRAKTTRVQASNLTT
jgi:hypothetical protein